MPEDVTSTLSDLERKLVDLERELQSVATGPTAALTSSGTGTSAAVASPPPAVEPAVRIDDLRGQIADLVRFRDQLESAARDLVAEYDRLVERLQAGENVAASAAMPSVPSTAAAAPAPPSMPIAPPGVAASQFHGGPVESSAGAPSPVPADGVDESMTFEGALVVDAGPFNDYTTLSTFEQAMARIPGAEDVYVRSFEGNRALIDIRLSSPVALVQALREFLPLPMTPREAADGRLVVDLATDGST